MIVSPSHLLCPIKWQMGAHGVNGRGGGGMTPHSYGTAFISLLNLVIETNKIFLKRYLIGQDNAKYNFSIELSLSSKGQNK